MKKVILLVVDAMASSVLEPAMEQGALPNFARLANAGELGRATAVFPSITPAATASIATGRYPAEHGIAGAYWYDGETDTVSYYGDDFWVVLARGIGSFFDDFLVKLNFERLRAPTIFEQIEDAGLEAAGLNFLWFRGSSEHLVHVPWLLRLFPGVPGTQRIRGPTVLCLGDLVTTRAGRGGRRLKGRGGAFRRFGFNDRNTAAVLHQLARGSLPELTLAYYPDNDYRSHEVGPARALDALVPIDSSLGELFALWGSSEQMLREVVVVVTADHSQTDTCDDADARAIDLGALLADYSLVGAGDAWSAEHDVMACPNMRAAQIYARVPTAPIIEKILSDERVDQVFWKERAGGDRCRYRVATRDRGSLRFYPVDHAEAPAASTEGVDSYGARWRWEGDLRALQLERSATSTLHSEEYPNPFERIAASFDERSTGDLWVTALPGFEFVTDRTETHSGGSHGSLHRGDSTVPLLVAGAPGEFRLPAAPRTVDVMPICLGLLCVDAPRGPGESHAADLR